MTLRILLIKVCSLSSKVQVYSPPMGVMYLTSYLRKHLDADVRIANAMLMDDPASGIASIMSSMDPHIVGLSGLTCEAFMLHKAAGIVRSIQAGIPVIAGGPYASSDPQRVLDDSNVDAVVVGEGEETFAELAGVIMAAGPEWRRPETLSPVRGLAYRDEKGQVQFSRSRPPITDLDALPMPAWDAIELERYWQIQGMSSAGQRPYLPLFTSRGCPYKCSFCHNLFGKRFRSRSAASVIDEMVDLRARYGVQDFEFLDDSVNLNRRRFTDILSGLLDRGLHPKLNFPNGIRTDLLDEETIGLIHRVGAGEISVAVETASPRLQKLIGKNLNLDRVFQNIDIMARKRMYLRGFFMMGFPTETEEEMRATVNYAVTSMLHVASFHVVNPFPATAIYREFEALGRLNDDANANDYEFYGAPFNGSDVPDETFRALYQAAYLRFYLRPGRMVRILRDRPYWTGYVRDVRTFLNRVFSFRHREERM